MSSVESPLIFPLTPQEIKDLKEGKALLKHYHNVHFPEDTLAVVIGRDWKREDYSYLLPRGISIAGVRIGGSKGEDEELISEEEFFEKLDAGVWFSRQKSPEGFPVYIAFMPQWAAEELQK